MDMEGKQGYQQHSQLREMQVFLRFDSWFLLFEAVIF